MRTVVGIDLAWGERAATGVVVARGDARRVEVLASATVTTDDDIAALVPAGPVVVAIDPRSAGERGARVALEVYPHAATVVLFGLDRILAYKPRRGRGLEDRRGALGALLGHLAGLRSAAPSMDVATGPRWDALVAGVADAPTMAALDRVEDEIDAHTCAYVGVLAAFAPERLAVVGEPATGLVVTPVDDRVRDCLAGAA